jgi:hypothetical protein
MHIRNSPWNINIICLDPFRFPSDRFAPYVGKIGTKNCTSICDVSVSHRAVFQKVKTYQTLEILLRGRCNHAHQAASSNSLFNLPLGITFELLRTVVTGVWWDRGNAKSASFTRM